MRRLSLLVLSVVVLGVAAPAAAQEVVVEGGQGGHGFGVGVEQNLGGLTGAAFVYDATHFHIDVLFGFQHFSNDGPDTTLFGIGARFFYVISQMGAADFSLGGGVGIVQSDRGNASDTEMQIEGAAQIRAFVVPNVAVTASLGLAILTNGDLNVGGGPVLFGGEGESAFGIGGQLFGGFGLTYFFR